MGGEGPGRGGGCVIEHHPCLCHRVDGWGRGALVAVAAEVVGAQGVDRNQNEVAGCGRLAPREEQDRAKGAGGEERYGAFAISRAPRAY